MGTQKVPFKSLIAFLLAPTGYSLCDKGVAVMKKKTWAHRLSAPESQRITFNAAETLITRNAGCLEK